MTSRRAFTPMLVEDLRDQMVASRAPALTVRKALDDASGDPPTRRRPRAHSQ